MQAITTKYLGCTATRPSRCKATAAGGKSMTVSWDHGMNAEGNHSHAARKLAASLGWRGEWLGSDLDKSGMVWVRCLSPEFFMVEGEAPFTALAPTYLAERQLIVGPQA